MHWWKLDTSQTPFVSNEMKLTYHAGSSMWKNIKWNFIDAKREVKNFFVRMKYHYDGGYLCHECGVTIPIYYSDMDSVVNGKRFMISNYGDHLYCPHCIAERIDAFMIAADLDDHPCDWYPTNHKTIGIIGKHFGTKQNQALAEDLGLNIRFGCSWWNGHQASRHALLTALLSDKLTYRSSMSTYKDGKVVMVDRYGIEMERKGW